MKAIIPTGGQGTRMRPLTFSSNKHFLPVANKPLIFYPIETVADAGIKDILITYNLNCLEQVKNVLGDGSRWGVNFTYVLQEKPAGLANIFQVCEEALEGKPFFLHLGDNIFTDGIKEFVTHFEKEKPDGLVPMVHHKENKRLGVPYFDKQGRLVKYVEKPENPPHDFAIPGLYFFDNTVFKCFKGEGSIKPSARGELEINTPFQWLIDHGYRVDVLEYKGVWLDPGKFDDWLKANKYLLEHRIESSIKSQPDESSVIEGKVQIGNGCTITKTTIKGPVSIGDNVTLFEAKIGPHASISNDCVIEGSQVENSVLLNNVKITNVKGAINNSLVGAETEITDHRDTSDISLFVGDKCKVSI